MNAPRNSALSDLDLLLLLAETVTGANGGVISTTTSALAQ
jgi:hypothetical protein